MHVEVEGQGPALVLLHGWAMHGGILAPLARRLRDAFTVHRVDLPGHGGSGAVQLTTLADCAAQVRASVPAGAAWLGWSLGGLVALQAALDAPQSLRALVMLSAVPRFTAAADWPRGVSPAVFSGFHAELGRDWRATVERFLALESHGSDHALEELRLLRRQVFAHGEPAPSALAAGLSLLGGSDLRARLPTLALPSLWLCGRRDRLVDWRAAEAAAMLAPAARFQRIDGGGHAPFLGHGDAVAAAVRDFLGTQAT